MAFGCVAAGVCWLGVVGVVGCASVGDGGDVVDGEALWVWWVEVVADGFAADAAWCVVGCGLASDCFGDALPGAGGADVFSVVVCVGGSGSCACGVPGDDGLVDVGWSAVLLCSADAGCHAWVADVCVGGVESLFCFVLVCGVWECADDPGGDVRCGGDVVFESGAFC